MLDSKALEIAKARYFMDHETSWEQLATRVGVGIGESTADPEKYGRIFSDIINDMSFIPGGRILRNVGRQRGSLFNCYHLPIGDSREEIGECFKNSLILWGEGGGIGINFSSLRPEGALIKGVGGRSSGAVSFMRALDGIASTIESGGQRRAASLGLLEVWHPEILKFIHAKNKDKMISYFNISVGVTNDFLEAVQRDDEWNLHWQQQVWATVPARMIWDYIIEGMLNNGEPGLLNMSNLRTNNSWYFAPISGTNPCGEATLEANGVCNLGSLVLPKFVDSAGRVQWSRMEEVIEHAIRFLDCCIDVNKYSLWDVRQTAQRARRIGLGVMGFADMLFACNIRYDSAAALDFAERLFKFIRNSSYTASIKLAQEKGAFPAYDAFSYCKSKFIRTLPPGLRGDIRRFGIRNVTLNAVAPTGTISLVANTTASIEPLMYKAYRRNDRVSSRVYLHPRYRGLGKDVPHYLVDSTELKPIHHIEMQSVIQKYTDGAVSKTINVPADCSSNDLSDIMLESIFDLKGTTIYRDTSREGQPIVPISIEEAERFESNSIADAETIKCAGGTCDI